MIDDRVQPFLYRKELERMISSLPYFSKGTKNKMESNSFSTICKSFSNKVKTPLGSESIDKEFLFWLSGFTDGEGSFSITLDRAYIRFRFKINLHIDDLLVLNIIKSKLNIGRIIVEDNKNSCAFVVQSFSEFKDVICPIFLNFPLLVKN